MTVIEKQTRFGTVYRNPAVCQDDYDNIVTSRVFHKPSGVIRIRPRVQSITAQRGLIKALRDVEEHLGFEVVVTGSARTCALQAALYKKDPDRYAKPSEGLHCQALAIDVNTTWQAGLSDKDEARFKAWMKHNGFTQARPDEPWHWSYGWTA